MAFQNCISSRRRGSAIEPLQTPLPRGLLHLNQALPTGCPQTMPISQTLPCQLQRPLHSYSHQRPQYGRNENYPHQGLTRAQVHYQQTTYGVVPQAPQHSIRPAPSAILRRRPRLTFSRWHMMVSSRYKTEQCRQFTEEADCPFGDKCLFAHGNDELRPMARHPKYKTELCRDFHQEGFCSFGPRCNFIHSTTDVASLSALLQSRASTPDSGNESCDDSSADSLVSPTTPTVSPDLTSDNYFQFPLDWYRKLTDDTGT